MRYNTHIKIILGAEQQQQQENLEDLQQIVTCSLRMIKGSLHNYNHILHKKTLMVRKRYATL